MGKAIGFSESTSLKKYLNPVRNRVSEDRVVEPASTSLKKDLNGKRNRLPTRIRKERICLPHDSLVEPGSSSSRKDRNWERNRLC